LRVEKEIFTLFILIVAVILFLNSCSSLATQTAHFRAIEEKIQEQNFASAADQLASYKNRHYKTKDRVLFYLDLGMLHHYNHDYEKSNEYLTEAEDAIDYLFTRSISRATASILLNDNVLEYSGEDYEDIYINIFKAINFIKLDEFDKAFVEIRRVNEKLNVLEDKYRDFAKSLQQADEVEIDFEPGSSRFHNSILGRYLSMLIYRTEGQLDDARIDYNYINDGWQQQRQIYNFPKPDLSSHLKIGDKAKVNFISFAGRAPEKKGVERRITTFDNYLIVSGNEPEAFAQTIFWPGLDKDYHFKFSLPIMQKRSSQVSRVRVFVDDSLVTELEKIEDISNIAVETFNVKAPLIYLKAITRSVVKGLIAEKAKADMDDKTGDIGSLIFRIATDIAVDLSENADLRIARFFPGKALVGEIELEPGVYDVRIEYLNRYGSVVFVDRYDSYNVIKNHLNLINSFYLN
jgi:hypothetical protein